MKLKKNDIIYSDIIDITNLGFGVSKEDGQVIFTEGLVTGDRAKIKIIKATSSYLVGRCEELISPSPMRAVRCDNTRCHACAYKNIGYSDEAKIKEEGVRQIFKKAGLPEIKINKIIASPKELSYRNKAQYPIAQDRAGNYVIGFYAPMSHRVTEAACCPLTDKSFVEMIECARDFFADKKLTVYDESTGLGLLRHIYIRRADVTKEVLFTLVINGTSLPCAKELAKRLTKRFPEIVGVLINENTKNTNVILGEKFSIISGRDYIIDRLAGVELKITAPSFYQVNHASAEILYAKARELAELRTDDLLLDLYCGAGSIGLSMAEDCGELIGIEIVDSAVECARFNAERNGAKNASFYTGDAKDTERLLENAEALRGEKIRPDVIILDPPRAGSDKKLLSHIATLTPRKIVYISCNPTTLARDISVLKPLGYTAKEVTPVDLFPMTGHCECITVLQRQ